VKLATMILPTHDNNGVDMTDNHCALRLVLLDNFDGFTVAPVCGAWRDSSGNVCHDDSASYSIAMDDTAENRAKLETIARFYGHLCGQVCVMVTHAGGDVAFVACTRAAEIAREPSAVELHAWSL
jgi:hypothetical protein